MLRPAVAELDLGSHADEELALSLDVADLGDVFENDLAFGEDGGGHAGERGVFGSGDFDGAEKGVAAAYYELVHLSSLLGSNEEMGDKATTKANANVGVLRCAQNAGSALSQRR